MKKLPELLREITLQFTLDDWRGLKHPDGEEKARIQMAELLRMHYKPCNHLWGTVALVEVIKPENATEH